VSETTPDAMADNLLGSFIRSRRESITPADVGLPEGGRRRTPGLRRSELATIAGVSVDYLIRLEQGRDRNPSGSVVVALADALRLGDEDRMHLKRLAAVSSHPEFCPAYEPPSTDVRPTVRAVLDRLDPSPAIVLNQLSDVLAWTDGYEAIGGPVGVLDADRPNLARYVFGDRRARRFYPDWHQVADQQVANLRSWFLHDHPELETLVAELSEIGGDEFGRRWNARPVARKTTGVKRIDHPEAGELRLQFETMELSDDAGQSLVVYLPADEATEAAIDRLTGRFPGSLHAVEASDTA